MFQPVTLLQIIWALFVWSAIIFGVPLACVLIYNCFSRGIFRRKKDAGNGDAKRNDPIRCLNCGAPIESGQQACPKCGWTWK